MSTSTPAVLQTPADASDKLVQGIASAWVQQHAMLKVLVMAILLVLVIILVYRLVVKKAEGMTSSGGLMGQAYFNEGYMNMNKREGLDNSAATGSLSNVVDKVVQAVRPSNIVSTYSPNLSGQAAAEQNQKIQQELCANNTPAGDEAWGWLNDMAHTQGGWEGYSGKRVKKLSRKKGSKEGMSDAYLTQNTAGLVN